MPPEPRLDIAPSLAAMEDQLDRSPLVSAGRAPEPRVVPERDEAPLSPQAEPRFAAERKEDSTSVLRYTSSYVKRGGQWRMLTLHMAKRTAD